MPQLIATEWIGLISLHFAMQLIGLLIALIEIELSTDGANNLS